MLVDTAVSTELVDREIQRTRDASMGYLFGLGFIVRDTARDPEFSDNHLLAYLSQDLLQSALSLPLLVTEGIWSVARRELRFILEASLKLAFIQQQDLATPIGEKLASHEGLLSSPAISFKSRLRLDMLSEQTRQSFLDEVGRLYGAASNYVHFTHSQLLDRIRAVDAGHTAGFESEGEATEANELIFRTLAASLVLLLHSSPTHVAGDLLVQGDGTSCDWFFAKSKYIAEIDAYFDYKHERQRVLSTVMQQRQASLAF